MKIEIKIDGKPFQNELNRIKELPGTMMRAINNLAFEVRDGERDNIRHVFANPRPFTQNSVGVRKATTSDPSATVFVKDKTSRYLRPYEDGGGLHYVPGRGIMFVPVGAKTDQYGQLRRGQFSRMAALPNTFVGQIAGVEGLWARLKAKAGAAGRLKLLVRMTPDVPVRKELGFGPRAAEMVKAGFSGAFSQAVERMLAK